MRIAGVGPPREKHWHGATATTGMTHIAIREHLDGKVVEWKDFRFARKQVKGTPLD